ncbi:putative porin [Gangjinia marincola]|uniref:Porin n=2 Tax=Gangjinia marincola TaxID=578463 RepID=A0ABN1MHL6_9FLAO
MLVYSFQGFSQERPLQQSKELPQRTDAPTNSQQPNNPNQDNNEKGRKTLEPRPISEYKIISVKNDTTHVDTALTIVKDYEFNYLRKDDLHLLPFTNVGQTYVTLSHTFNTTSLMPLFGARARHFNYYEVEDINYYHVPTPVTELYFRTVFEQGQNLEAFFTTNISPQVNIFIGYKGLRSLGKYQHILTSTGNFQVGFSVDTKNDRYHVKTHFTAQDLLNQENGGLSPQGVINYLGDDEEFDDRSALDVNFEDAENILDGRRFYLNQSYDIIKKNDSIQNNQITLGHVIDFTDKEYRYEQSSANEIFGEAFETTNLRDEVEFQEVNNQLSLTFSNAVLGRIGGLIGHADYNYGYQRVLIQESGTIPNRLIGDVFYTGATYNNTIGKLAIDGLAKINVSGDFDGNHIQGAISYPLSIGSISASVSTNSRRPNYNFLLYQSDYVEYNWFNDFDNVQTQRLAFDFKSKKYVDASLTFTTINNYTYFAANGIEVDQEGFENPVTFNIAKPTQYDEQVNYLKLKASKTFEYGVLGSSSDLIYQNVSSDDEVLNVPDIVVRSSLYYKDHWFDKALYLQTGFTAKYFTSYNGDGYDPILAEFYTQNQQEIEGFPIVDFFFNAKIKTARIYFKVENIPSLLFGNDNFVAPAQPFRDDVIRFGLQWNYFL